MNLTVKNKTMVRGDISGFHAELEDALKNSMTVEQTFGD
jgi:hypothetical protein